MRTKIRWAEVHAPLFLFDPDSKSTQHSKGYNLKQKLCTKERRGLVLEYDEDKRHLFVAYEGMVARVPETSVLCMIEATGCEPKTQPVAAAPKPAHEVAVDAQVSSPQSHVFAGPGAGQTGQEPPKPMPTVIAEAMAAAARRGPGRPPKDKP